MKVCQLIFLLSIFWVDSPLMGQEAQMPYEIPRYMQDALLITCAMSESRSTIDTTYLQLCDDYYYENKHSFRCLEKLLDELTFMEFERTYLKQQLSQWSHLPFPVIWAVLDRQSPITTTYLTLNEFCDRNVELPKEKQQSDQIELFLAQYQYEKMQEQNIYDMGGGDVCLTLKIVLLKQIRKRLEIVPSNWPSDWRARVIDELNRRVLIKPQTIEDWYLKEAYQEALIPAKGQSKTDFQTVWETLEFKEWWEKNRQEQPVKLQ